MAGLTPKGLKEKILAKLTGPTLCALATVTEDGKPWVRYMILSADEHLTMWGATSPVSGRWHRYAGTRRFTSRPGPKTWRPPSPTCKSRPGPRSDGPRK